MEEEDREGRKIDQKIGKREEGERRKKRRLEGNIGKKGEEERKEEREWKRKNRRREEYSIRYNSNIIIYNNIII